MSEPSSIRSFFKNTGVYGVGILIGKLTSFLILPVLTAYLTPTDLGVLTLLQVFAAILSMFANAGVQQAIARNYFDEDTDRHRASVVGTGLLWRMILTTVVVGILAIAAGPVTGVLLGASTEQYIIYYLFSLANVAIMAPQSIAYTLYRVRMQSVRNVTFSTVGSITFFVLALALVWSFQRGIRGVLEASLLASLLITLAMLPDILKAANLRFRKDILKGILSYGLPLLPHSLAVYLLFGADRFILEHYWSGTEVGVYSYGYRISMGLALFSEAVGAAWSPFIYSLQNGPDAGQIQAVASRYVMILLIGVACVLCILGDEMVMLLAYKSPEYWGSMALMPLIIGGNLCFGLYQQFSSSIGIVKRTRLLPIVSVCALVINLVLNFALVPSYGMMGAAVATFIAYLSMAFIGLTIAQSVHPIPYEWGRLARLVLVGAFCYGVSLMIPTWSFWPTMCVKAACIITFPILLYFAGVIKLDDRQRIVGLVKDMMDNARS
jgi:O-antigen/teichoic acid export membrane protein